MFVETSIKDGNIDETLVDLCKLMINNLENELKCNTLSSLDNSNIKLGINDLSRKRFSEMKRKCC